MSLLNAPISHSPCTIVPAVQHFIQSWCARTTLSSALQHYIECWCASTTLRVNCSTTVSANVTAPVSEQNCSTALSANVPALCSVQHCSTTFSVVPPQHWDQHCVQHSKQHCISPKLRTCATFSTHASIALNNMFICMYSGHTKFVSTWWARIIFFTIVWASGYSCVMAFWPCQHECKNNEFIKCIKL